jgi:hypothetical protein
VDGCSNFLLQLFPSYNLGISLRTLLDIDELQVTARANKTTSRHGIFVAITKCMNIVCRHCDETIVGQPYRVISEEDGVVLLNMVVCASCAAVAKSLMLHTEEIAPEHSPPSAPVNDVFDMLLDSFKYLRL